MAGRKFGFKRNSAAWIMILAAFFAVIFAGCGGKNEPTAETVAAEPTPVPEPALPDDAGKQQLFCIVTSDLHFTLSDVSSVYLLGKYTPELARAFADEAAARKPDVLIMCGDNTNSSRTEDLMALTAILEPLRKAGCEVILVTGNHDGGIGEDDFRSCVGRLCNVLEMDRASFSYTVRTHGCRFLAMDDNTAAPGGEKGAYTEETMEWLEAQLLEAEEAGERPVFISHHSLMTAGNEELDDYYRIDEPGLVQLLETHGVRLAFTGHRHSQEILQSGRICEIISAPLMASPHAYGELTVYEKAAHYKTVPLSIDRYGTRTLKEIVAGEEEKSAENLSVIVEAVCGKRYSRAKKERIGELFARFMQAYSEGTIADQRDVIKESPYYEEFLEAFEESNYGPWIRYMMENAEMPGNRVVIQFE